MLWFILCYEYFQFNNDLPSFCVFRINRKQLADETNTLVTCYLKEYSVFGSYIPLHNYEKSILYVKSVSVYSLINLVTNVLICLNSRRKCVIYLLSPSDHK